MESRNHRLRQGDSLAHQATIESSGRCGGAALRAGEKVADVVTPGTGLAWNKPHSYITPNVRVADDGRSSPSQHTHTFPQSHVVPDEEADGHA